jgi:hypothetical protein
MQCKDIPDLPILEFIGRVERKEVSHTYEQAGKFVTFFPGEASTWSGSGVGIPNVMPMREETPAPLVLAKMQILIRRGLVNGCACGCRGDFTLTDKGREFIASATKTGEM